jgi:hypothetical protein
MDHVGIFYGHLVYFVAIWYMYFVAISYIFVHLTYFVATWYILWSSGIVYGRLVYFVPFGKLYQMKIWQPWSSVGTISLPALHTLIINERETGLPASLKRRKRRKISQRK